MLFASKGAWEASNKPRHFDTWKLNSEFNTTLLADYVSSSRGVGSMEIYKATKSQKSPDLNKTGLHRSSTSFSYKE